MRASAPVRTARGFGPCAAAPHELAAAAALEIMRAGGNAVDGAVAANAVQGVAAPETCGVGGDLFALVHSPDRPSPACLNASGRAGEGADADALRGRGYRVMPRLGPASVTVPGCVDGWYALSERFGRLPLSASLAPALRLAQDGFPASVEFREVWALNRSLIRTQPSAAPLFPGGLIPEVGQRITRPFLAETLQSIAAGRDAFYLDRIGAAVTEATDGAITGGDLARPQADWVEPLSAPLFGLTAWTAPPNSQGYMALAALTVFEQLDAPADPFHPACWHALIEAYRSIAGERDHLLADPDSGGADGASLLDPAELAGRAARIDPDRAGDWSCPPPASGGTAYMCTVDEAGMGVSLIQSNFHGIGAGLSAGRTGVWLHNRGAGFNLTPGHPNELAPGRRPLHTLSPTIWTEEGRLALVLGARGGHLQPQLLIQIAAHRLHAGLDLAAALAMPRWAIDRIGSARPEIRVESRLSPSAAGALRRRRHRISTQRPWMRDWGPASAVELAADGLRQAAADPRVETALALAG